MELTCESLNISQIRREWRIEGIRESTGVRIEWIRESTGLRILEILL